MKIRNSIFLLYLIAELNIIIINLIVFAMRILNIDLHFWKIVNLLFYNIIYCSINLEYISPKRRYVTQVE